MSTINHKHADHIIVIEDNAFKANADGMWNLTEIWKVLGLTHSKAPSQWRTKSAQRLTTMQKMQSARVGDTQHILATKQAALKYAGWVSEDFEDTVYAAFEAILEMPEVATVVTNKMVELGYSKEAELLERHTDYSYAMKTLKGISSRVDGSKPARVYEALKRGTITHEQALEQIPKSSVWYDRAASWF